MAPRHHRPSASVAAAPPVPPIGYPLPSRRHWRRVVALLGFWCLAADIGHAAVASVQYYQDIDDSVTAAVVQAVGSDLKLRYEKDFPDDHVFPNGVRMDQFHDWVTHMLDAWNRQPLMPLHLSLERGQPKSDYVIKLDETGSETKPSSGKGGWGYQYLNQTRLKFTCRAIINVSSGYNRTRDEVEGVVKHELGHCLGLGHSSNRSAVMAYTTGDSGLSDALGYFALDDLLGLRSIWARDAPGFGSVAGRLVYPDGSSVGGGDVVALDADTGEVVASAFSDKKRQGRFRIELPAGRRVRVMAHSLQADVALLGSNFLDKSLLTPTEFAPTEYQSREQSTVFTVPNGGTQELDTFTVAPAPDPPLLNKDAQTIPLLPGERRHTSFRFSGLGSDPAQMRLTLASLTASHIVTHPSLVEFDVTAAADAAGVSALEVRSGAASNLQVGSFWVRPTAGLVRAISVDPLLVPKGATTAVVIQGYGLDRVTEVHFVKESGTTELPAQLAGPAPGGGLVAEVTVPANAVEGPWDVMLVTADGQASLAPDPHPSVWVGRGRLQPQRLIDLGDVPVKQPLSVAIPVKNLSATTYNFSSLATLTWLGQFTSLKVTNWPAPAPDHTGTLRLSVTPTSLGPTIMFVKCLGGGNLDAVAEVHWWGVPTGG